MYHTRNKQEQAAMTSRNKQLWEVGTSTTACNNKLLPAFSINCSVLYELVAANAYNPKLRKERRYITISILLSIVTILHLPSMQLPRIESTPSFSELETELKAWSRKAFVFRTQSEEWRPLSFQPSYIQLRSSTDMAIVVTMNWNRKICK